jgi:hypothetical protein
MTQTIDDTPDLAENNAWLKRYYFTRAGFSVVGGGRVRFGRQHDGRRRRIAPDLPGVGCGRQFR